MHLTYVLINIVIKYTLTLRRVNFLRCGKPQLRRSLVAFRYQRATGEWAWAIST
jgi:hypothetical protein